MPTVSLTPQRVARWKVAYTARNLDLQRPLGVVYGDDLVPRHGDLMLAKVTAIGQHTRLELATGRRATLYLDDEVLVAVGARYATDQFEADLPHDLGPCHLVAAGGIAGQTRSAHTKMSAPTELAPVGLLTDSDGAVINLAHLALPEPAPSLRQPPTLLVAGTSMNAGKTTAMAAIIRGLTTAGLRVGAAKITGTGAGGDPWLYRDAGAAEVLDFIDAGLAATYQVGLPVLLDCATDLHATLACRGVDAILLEIADGVLQSQTAALLSHPRIRALTDGVFFAASDAAGAQLGVHRLHAIGWPVLAVGGLLTASPLASDEAREVLNIPVYSTSELCNPVLAQNMLDHLFTPRTAHAAIGLPA